MSPPIDDALREQLDALLDGALPEAEASALRTRIDADDALHAEYELRRRTVELVRALPTERAPEGFVASVLDRLPATGAEVTPRSLPGSGSAGRLRSLWLWGSGLAAAAALMLAVSLRGGDPSGEEDWTLAKESSLGETDSVRDTTEGEEAVRAPEPGAATFDRSALEKTATDRGAADRDEIKGELSSLRGTPNSEAKEPQVSSEMEKGADAPDSLGTRPQAEAERAAASLKRDRSARKDTTPSLVVRVEQERTVLNPTQRREYLDTLTRLSDDTLRAHVDRMSHQPAARFKAIATLKEREARSASGRGVAKSTGKAKSAKKNSKEAFEPIAFDLALATRGEAETLRAVLNRAFPARFAQSGGIKTRRAPGTPKTSAADRSLRDSGAIQLDWSMTERQAATLYVWLDRIGLRTSRSSSPHAPGFAHVGGTRASGARARDAGTESDLDDEEQADAEPAVLVRVRIRYGPPQAKADDK